MFTSATRRCLTFRSRPVTRFATATRQLQVSSRQQYPRKDAQDKDSLAPESNEYSKSGSDAQSAATEEAAFSGDKTRPEEQEQHAAKESGGESNNPLNVSPANRDVSQPKGAQKTEQDGSAEGSPAESGSGSDGRSGASGGGSAPKSGGGKSGGGGGS